MNAETVSRSMRANVPPGGTLSNLPGGASAGVRTKPPTEDEVLAALWECSEKSAHTLKTHAARRAADVIRVRRAVGDWDGAARYAAPLEEVMAALPCPEPEKREGITDGLEDVRQAEFRAEPCERTARALLRERAAMRQASLDHDRVIAAEYGIQL